MPKIIDKNTVWRAGETVSLTDEIQIAAGATLTIQPGAIVNGNGFGINVRGVLNAIGTEDSRVVLDNVQFTFGRSSSQPGSINLSYASISGGAFLPATGYASYGDFHVTDSHLSGVGGFHIWYPVSNSSFERNVFENSAVISAGVSGPHFLIKDNVFTENSGGVEVWANYSDSISVISNTFLGTNRTALAVSYGYDSAKLIAQGNYFGTSDPSVIASLINDRTDDLNYASVINWSPAANGPSVAALNALSASGLPIMIGTSAADTLTGGEGATTIYGGDGDDQISDSGGSDTLFGGGGADTFFISRGDNNTTEHVIIDAGSGDDVVTYQNYRAGSLSVALGAGNDRITLWTAQSGGASLSLGSGRDVISLAGSFSLNASSGVTVSDFATGAAGDRLDLAQFLNASLQGWDGIANPFGRAGYLRLVQSGDSATLFQIDRDGATGGGAFSTLFTFENTKAVNFTASNLGGFAANGSITPNQTLIGTSGADALNGGTGADTIRGLDGNDIIDGNAGNDRIDGGSGNDTIEGGTGDDIIDAGEGDDYISDIGGSDTLFGGLGSDRFFISRGDNGTTENVVIDAGAGNDSVIYQNYRSGSVSINLGEGDDSITFWTIQNEGARLTLGAGQDTVKFSSLIDIHQQSNLSIVDFETGSRGDTLDFAEYYSQALTGWNGSDNPFGTAGYLRLVQYADKAVLQIDKDGAAGSSQTYQPLVIFENANAGRFTSSNFGGFTPTIVKAAQATTATINAPKSITEDGGQSLNLSVTLNNVSRASGTVTMSFSAAQSTVTNGVDVSVPSYSGSYSITQVPAGAYTLALPSIDIFKDQIAEGTETIAVTIRASGQVFDTGTDTKTVLVKLIDSGQTGTAGNDTLTGTRFADELSGFGGNDTLRGGAGNDRIDGGAGRDTAVFSGVFDQSRVTIAADHVTVVGPDGTDTLYNVEEFAFVDGVFTFDGKSLGAQVTRMYDTVLGRAPDGIGMDHWVSQLQDGKLTLSGMASELANSAEFQQATGGLGNTAFVDYVFQHALGRAPDGEGRAYWTAQLDNGMSRGDLLVGFSESAEHQSKTAALVSQGYFHSDDTAQAVALLYDSFTNRLPDLNGLTFWTNEIKTGSRTLAQVANEFAGSGEFAHETRGLNNGQLVDYMYQNTLDRLPDGGGRAFWVDQLDKGLSLGQLLLEFSQSAEHQTMLAPHIIGGIDII